MEAIKMTAATLSNGEYAKVVSLVGDESITKRLMEMGIVPGVTIRKIKSAPFGDPIEIRVLGYSLAVRKKEASQIQISKD
jgi:ferrous iron transport protein A